MSAPDYASVTERPGQRGSRAQLERAVTRYRFAQSYCRHREVLEVACGVGQGLGILASEARRVVGLDIDSGNVAIARATYARRQNIELVLGDAERLPFSDESFDVVVLYEAIYYLPHVERFVAEARRVLRRGGTLLVCTANKDLPDFNPSPFSVRYLGASELRLVLVAAGFETEFYGDSPVGTPTLSNRVLRGAKAAVVRLGLMPKTMRGKELLKRVAFGKLVPIPGELTPEMAAYRTPARIAGTGPDLAHYVIHCVARLPQASAERDRNVSA